MSLQRGAGGGPIVAIAHGKTGVHVAVDGGEARPIKVGGPITVATIGAALEGFSAATVRLVGTRHDGTPGWDSVDSEELHAALPTCTVECLSEAQALHVGWSGEGPVAYIILATAPGGSGYGHIVGSARWWVEDAEGNVGLTDVYDGGRNCGQIYTAPGDPLTASPIIVANMVGETTKRHSVRVVRVWSQDGLSTNPNFTVTVVRMGTTLANRDFVNEGGRVEVISTAYEMLSAASRPEPAVPAAGGDSNTTKSN